RHKRRSALAPFDKLGIPREQQLAAIFRRLMAAGAMPLQDRPDLAIKADRLFSLLGKDLRRKAGEGHDRNEDFQHHGRLSWREKKAGNTPTDLASECLYKILPQTSRRKGADRFSRKKRTGKS